MPPNPDRPGESVKPPTPAAAEQATAASTARAEELRSDIAARLRRVCSNLSDEQFAALVHEIADVKLRYEDRERHGGSRPADRRTRET
jgi:hypothetical protein